jgi:hypothetical protein
LVNIILPRGNLILPQVKIIYPRVIFIFPQGNFVFPVDNTIFREDAMSDYLPKLDRELSQWMTAFLTALNDHAQLPGLSAADRAALEAAAQEYQTALSAHTAAVNAARAARRTRDTAKDAMKKMIRPIVRQIQANPATTDALRVRLGLARRNGSASTAASNEATCPLVRIDTGHRLRHTVHFIEATTPTRRAKPHGVLGCEIWVAVTAPGEAADASAYRFLAMDPSTPYLAEWPGSQIGKTAHYLARWLKTDGTRGPWSETVSATIVG